MTCISGEHWTVHHGDCREAFLSLPAKSVHCVVTSPPYWGGVRDYGIVPSTWADGWEGCYGNEPTVEAYVAHTLEVFNALGHALREDGVIWWNIGDTFATSGGSGDPGGSSQRAGRTYQQRNAMGVKGGDIRTGNKCLVPFRVAIALQEAGWIIRQDNIWRKPSPMPESIDGWRWERCRVKVSAQQPPAGAGLYASGSGDSRCRPGSGGVTGAMPDEFQTKWEACQGCDKCRDSDGYVLRRGSWRSTTAHEFVFQIVRSPKYFCDAAAASEVAIGGAPGNKNHSQAALYEQGDRRHRRAAGLCQMTAHESRNPRSVWTISSEAYKGKHFAAFPTMLAWKCIQASTSAGGCCAVCGSQYAPIVEKGRVATRPALNSKVWKQDEAEAKDGQRSTASPNRDPYRHIAVKRTTGYRPTCDCNAGEPAPCVVADPFTGSGTVLQVSINTGRQFVGSEIAPHYLPLIQERAATPWAPKTQKRNTVRKRKLRIPGRALFS